MYTFLTITLSCNVSYSTREVAIGQIKDKAHVHHSHLCTRIVLTDGHRIHFKFANRDAFGGNAFPLSTNDFQSKDRAFLQSTILLKMVVLCQRYVAMAVANGGGVAMPSMAGAHTKKMEFPLNVKCTISPHERSSSLIAVSRTIVSSRQIIVTKVLMDIKDHRRLSFRY